MNTPPDLSFKAKILIFVCLLFAFNQAAADNSGYLYNIEKLVADESSEIRWRTFKEGLDEVFIRISGDSIVMDKIKRPAASTYIKQYSYDPVESPVTDDRGVSLNYRLKIQYNGSAMEKYLLDSGFPVWSEHRRDVVVWLAVRDGRNEYVLKNTDKSLIKTVADEAMQRRGLPDRWPVYDRKDKKNLSVAEIRGGFKDPVLKASARYGKGPALAGSMIWNGKKWQSSWSLLMGSSDRHWSIEDADYNTLINKAVDQAADAMGIAFAVRDFDKNRRLAAVHVNVQAVNSIDKYRKVENYLSSLRVVEMTVPVAVDGNNATFEVRLRGSEADLLDLIKNGSELAAAEALIPENPIPGIGPDILDIADADVNNAGTNKSGTTKSGTTKTDISEMDAENTGSSVNPKAVAEKTIAVYHYKLIH